MLFMTDSSHEILLCPAHDSGVFSAAGVPEEELILDGPKAATVSTTPRDASVLFRLGENFFGMTLPMSHICQTERFCLGEDIE